MDHPVNEAVPTSGAPAEHNGTVGAEANGTEHAAGPAAASAHAEPATGHARDRMERAEEIVDRVSSWVGNMTSLWGKRLIRAGSRIREEAEDFWAEAQNIRRGDKS
jgi:hypothetical protein